MLFILNFLGFKLVTPHTHPASGRVAALTERMPCLARRAAALTMSARFANPQTRSVPQEGRRTHRELLFFAFRKVAAIIVNVHFLLRGQASAQSGRQVPSNLRSHVFAERQHNPRTSENNCGRLASVPAWVPMQPQVVRKTMWVSSKLCALSENPIVKFNVLDSYYYC